MSRDGDGHALRDLKPQGMSPPPTYYLFDLFAPGRPARDSKCSGGYARMCIQTQANICIIFFNVQISCLYCAGRSIRSAGRPDGWSKMSITFWQLCLYMVCERRFAVMRTATSCGPYGHTEGVERWYSLPVFCHFYEINISENAAGHT